MKIEHLVLSGGGPTCLISYGVLKQLAKKGFWHYEDIKSIYGCSAGAFISVVILLNYNWDWIDDFFIKRPWEELLNICPDTILNINENCGVIKESLIKNMLEPLFRGKDLSPELTMREFYNFTQIETNIYTCNIKNDIKKVCINHKTFPDLPVYKAVFMSLSIPGICVPISTKDGFYIDGGYLCHYPVMELVNNTDIENDSILGVFLLCLSTDDYQIDNNSTLFDIYKSLFNKLIDNSNDKSSFEKNVIKNSIQCNTTGFKGMQNWYDLSNNQDLRIKHIERGVEDANKFLQNQQNHL